MRWQHSTCVCFVRRIIMGIDHTVWVTVTSDCNWMTQFFLSGLTNTNRFVMRKSCNSVHRFTETEMVIHFVDAQIRHLNFTRVNSVREIVQMNFIFSIHGHINISLCVQVWIGLLLLFEKGNAMTHSAVAFLRKHYKWQHCTMVPFWSRNADVVHWIMWISSLFSRSKIAEIVFNETMNRIAWQFFARGFDLFK